jgi:enamine deaminase RidA (YjgF/YER057c/UK114 family)
VIQARVSLDNLIAILDGYGARPENLVKTTVYVVGDRQDLVTVWEVVADGLAPSRPPSTLLGVSALGHSGQLVEIEGIAALRDHGEKGEL